MLPKLDGVGPEREMGEARGNLCFTRDGKGVVQVRIGDDTRRDLWYFPFSSDDEARPFLKTPAEETSPALSPEGFLLAYQSDKSGREEIYLTHFPSGEGKWQVSVDGGQRPLWNPNGRELFFLHENALLAVDVQTEPSLAWGTPKKLLDGEGQGILLWRGFDVAADGERFVVMQNESKDQVSQGIIVVENWFAEFKNRP